MVYYYKYCSLIYILYANLKFSFARTTLNFRFIYQIVIMSKINWNYFILNKKYVHLQISEKYKDNDRKW